MNRTRENPEFIPSEPLAQGGSIRIHVTDTPERGAGGRQAGSETKALSSHPVFFLLPPSILTNRAILT